MHIIVVFIEGYLSHDSTEAISYHTCAEMEFYFLDDSLVHVDVIFKLILRLLDNPNFSRPQDSIVQHESGLDDLSH